jgi:hypothetical protein
MVDTLNQAGVRSGLLSEFTKSKGLASFDDEEEEPLRQLEDQHQLSVHVEHCDCIRPSHHLRGSREKYTQYYADVSVYMQKFEGAGEVVVKANQPEWSGLPTAQPATQAADMLAQSMQAKPKRPASAAPSGRTPLQPMALPGGLGDQFGFLTPQQGRWPRVGSFEVNYTLLNVKSKASYGPYLLSSKLMTERWPNEAKVHGHLQEHLQLLLKQDEQHYALEKMVRTKIDEKKALTAETEPPPAVYSAEDLRAPGFATAAPRRQRSTSLASSTRRQALRHAKLCASSPSSPQHRRCWRRPRRRARPASRRGAASRRARSWPSSRRGSSRPWTATSRRPSAPATR